MSQVLSVRCHINSFFSSCSYVIEFPDSIWIIDPGDSENIYSICSKLGKPVKTILITHAHYDHIYGINDLIAHYNTCPIITNDFGRKMLCCPKLNLSKYHDIEFCLKDDSMVCGFDTPEGELILKSTGFEAIFTPGHSPSCLTFFNDTMLFSGDAYIPGIKTVVNLPHANKNAAIVSEIAIRNLAKCRRIYPGHPSDT